jgi:hypothetical protein
MPVSDTLLAERTNSHLLISANMTIGEVFAAFQAVGGKSWWVLVVDYGENRYGLLWLWHLAKQMGLLGSGAPDWKGALSYDEQIRFWLKRSESMASVIPSNMLETVERNRFSDKEVWAFAETSPGRALVVLDNGCYVGLVNNRYIKDF